MKKYIPAILTAYGILGTFISATFFGVDGIFTFVVANILGVAGYFFGEQFK